MSAIRKTLQGSKALVIGGGSGIGFGSARLLARDGATVTIAGRTEQKLVDATAALASEGLEVRHVVCDAMNAADVRAAVDAASDGGRLHIAVVVPGGGSYSPVLLYGDDQFGAEVDANARPVFLTLKYAGQAMVRAGGGAFVAVSSTAAVFSSRFLASYAVGKAAVDQLVRVAADELGEAHIRVNSVRPGLTRTATTAGLFSREDVVDEFLALQALPRSGEVEDIAHAIRYMAGPESSWVTGQLLTVDGGNTLRAFPDPRKFLDLPDWQAYARAADQQS
jgi:NAD(P)-dependent dehydrogenase (short-subunit alcohol dehydrogenase family)